MIKFWYNTSVDGLSSEVATFHQVSAGKVLTRSLLSANVWFWVAVIDTDALLAKDLLTLDEALKTSYNAVMMATNAISVLVSVS